MNLDYRYEIKFVLSTIKFHEAINWLHTCTNARKAFENRTVNSVYFDDFDEQNVDDYNPGGYGDIADEIIERGIEENFLDEDDIE